MRVVIGSDHAGLALKEAVKAFLTADHHELLDLGTHSPDPVDYSDYAEAVGRALRENRAERGILLCGSGVARRWPPTGFRGFAPDCVMTPIRRTRALSTTT
jgi:RpiB/LacA/LacB family sugar-phosphate isomerase